MTNLMSETIEAFRIDVDDSVLEDLSDRLARTRFPDQIEGTGWEYGIPIDYLRQLVEYWRNTYDWRAQEARLNRFAHFRTSIDGQLIHFVHARSPHADALPLLITHGWPGSVVEFLDAIPRLTDPGSLRRPSRRRLPRDRAVTPGLRLLRASPHSWLGCPAHSTGFRRPHGTPGLRAATARREGIGALRCRHGSPRLDPEHCAAIHLNMPLATRPKDAATLTDEEQADLAAMERFMREESGYANEQGTKPQTVGAALNDSPAGLLAWIVEKFRTWSDCDGHPENCFTKDQLITNVMLYWVTQTSASSARLYWETRHSGALTDPLPFIDQPTGIARYPKEPLRWPRSWIERKYNVTHWVTMPRGGHFAAMEQPELFVDDLRMFFRSCR